MFPYLDAPGFIARTVMPPGDVAILETQFPGYVEQRIATRSSLVNARLRKRYGAQGVLPFGQVAPPLLAAGSSPPAVTLAGRPTLGSVKLRLAVLVAGPLGSSTFWWSADDGLTWTLGPTLAASGTTPPAVAVAGAGKLPSPGSLRVEVTTAGVLGVSRFQWSEDGGATWNIGAAMAATGTTPPGVSLVGTSGVALPSDIVIQITTPGALGTAVFQWSQDGGATFTTGLSTSATPVLLGSTGLVAVFSLGNYAANNVYTGQGIATAALFLLGATGLVLDFPAGTYAADNVYLGQGAPTAASVPLLGTGMQALFPVGMYAADNVYAAATPVPETILDWIVALVTLDAYDRRGVNAQDPAIERVVAAATEALARLQEAADGKEGLIDLPTTEDGDTAIVTGGPLGYHETSPYVWTDEQRNEGRTEDRGGGGDFE